MGGGCNGDQDSTYGYSPNCEYPNPKNLSRVKMHDIITEQRLEPILGEALLDLHTNTNVQII